MKRGDLGGKLVAAKKPKTPAKARKPPAEPSNLAIDASAFRRRLMAWYRLNARALPWRGATDPYHTWVSETMLQQTRVAAVLDHYAEFLRRFPTLVSLALAPEAEVLAAWSGLGYYRRARMLHKAAQFIVLERNGRLPTTSAELRSLPGIGDYTAAAIASIAFGESVAVVDGNVERVLLRLTGRPNDATAQGRAFVQRQAQALVPAKRFLSRSAPSASPRRKSAWDASERIALAAAADPTALEALSREVSPETEASIPANSVAASGVNAAGDHNQAMMELGATVCLPKAPLCLTCPVYDLCLTRGEHRTPGRAPQRSQAIAYLLHLRKLGPITEVLLARRPEDASLMPGMFELPPLANEAVEGREPVLRLRHSITNTNYYVQVFSPPSVANANTADAPSPVSATQAAVSSEVGSMPPDQLHWTRASRLPGLPLTGLARKILQRLDVMDIPNITLLE
jgi:A/G-specific adenine glycosylase